MGKLMGGVSADVQQELRQCVLRGAAFLDEVSARDEELVPRNWRDVLSRPLLNMASSDNCVLGQLAQYKGVDYWSSFVSMATDLGFGSGDHEKLVEYGFVMDPDMYNAYGPLTVVWQQYLDECRAG